MATGGEVLSMLIPNGGWYIVGDDYESFKFLECEPITNDGGLTYQTRNDIEYKLHRVNKTLAVKCPAVNPTLTNLKV